MVWIRCLVCFSYCVTRIYWSFFLRCSHVVAQLWRTYQLFDILPLLLEAKWDFFWGGWETTSQKSSTQHVICYCNDNTIWHFAHRHETTLWALSRKWRSWWRGLGLQIRTINPRASGRWKASCTSRRNVSLSSWASRQPGPLTLSPAPHS